MTYTELVAAAKAYADRQDVEVDANIDIFILMAEARINRILKTREQSTRVYAPAVTGQEYYTLPPDYSGMRNIQLNDGDPGSDVSARTMSYLSPEQFDTQRSKAYGGKLYYTIIAGQIQIYPLQETGSTFEIVYWQNVPNLNATDSTNWLSIGHPDIYLSGIISEIESFVKNYEVSKAWDAKMSRSIGELEQSDVIENWSGSTLTTRVE